MVAQRQPHRWTPEEYLAFERASDTKHEYFDGEIYDMAGASDSHERIFGSTYASLYAQTRKRDCLVYGGNMRVRVSDKLYSYPDITVVCGKPTFTEMQHLDTLTNPAVIIEILSSSTSAFDRGEKLHRYIAIPAAKVCLLIEQDKVHVDVYIRQPDGRWLIDAAEGLDSVIQLEAIGCTLALADIYEKIELEVLSNEQDDEEEG